MVPLVVEALSHTYRWIQEPARGLVGKPHASVQGERDQESLQKVIAVSLLQHLQVHNNKKAGAHCLNKKYCEKETIFYWNTYKWITRLSYQKVLLRLRVF